MTVAVDDHSEHQHAAPFYQDQQSLVQRVADSVAEGAKQGEPCLVISTGEPNAAFATAVGSHRVDDRDALVRKIAALEQRAAALEQRAIALEVEVAHRKQLESRLAEALAARRRSEELLRDFVDNATIGLHWVLADGTIEWANDAELKLLGYTRDEYIGRNIAEIHADAQKIGDILCRLQRNEAIHDYEAPLLAKDGSVKWVAISSNVLFDGDRFVHTRCFSRDITARKGLEEQNALLLEATGVMARSLDYRMRLNDLSRVIVPRLADCCIIDVAREDGYERLAIAHTDPDLGAAEGGLLEQWSAATERDPVRRVLQTGEPVIVPCVADEDLAAFAQSERHAGELRQLGLRSLMIVPMVTHGRVIGSIGLWASESRRRYTAEDLPLALDLAARAAGMVEIARLYHVAESNNRAKDEFLATLSHELRTPLTAIMGWARMLSIGGLDDETMGTAIATIEQSAKNQAALIEDLLDVSRVVSGKLSLESEPVDVTNVIGNVLHAMQLAAAAKGIRVDAAGLNERAVVQGDSTRLQQIVWNLVSNAIKFSEEGECVKVRLERLDGDARIVVRDEGRGIPQSFLPFVFDPFRQADATATRVHGGLGLGLAIVKYLVEAHGGTVTAESDGPGTGSTFTVTLPLARLTRSAGSQPDALADLSGIRILVVDDDVSSRQMLKTALGRCGAEVDLAANVVAARHAVARSRPDVVVTDIAMPDEDGMVLLRHLRGADETRSIPVFAFTAFHHRDDLQHEFDVFLKKPIDPMEIARRIALTRTNQ
ncbi:MAG TPA: ATP-binding protein [Thermoanaerobaculia bacterium]|nr:ATP-binding protein [Thermoanaerobaculia bacterium]